MRLNELLNLDILKYGLAIVIFKILVSCRWFLIVNIGRISSYFGIFLSCGGL